MITLYNYITENVNLFRGLIVEGGASGHMKYPYDYSDFTLADLKEIVENLFSGKITNITEKIDGMNIQATRNEAGEVVFVRNQGDLDSERGGMTKADMLAKWNDKPHVLDTFIKAADTIIEVFAKLPISFFNKDGKRYYVNCECVIAGKTNVMPYISDQVDFHDIWIYEFNDKKAHWMKTEVTREGLDKLEKASEKTNAKLTPQVIIDVTKESDSIAKSLISKLDKVFKKVSLYDNATVEEYKQVRFMEIVSEKYNWIFSDMEAADWLYNRWYNNDKSINIRLIRARYSNDLEELDNLDKKGYKELVRESIRPLDEVFIEIGNSILKLCKGIINTGQESNVVAQLTQDLKDTIADVRKNGSAELNNKLGVQLSRLGDIADVNINATEGIVFSYKGKLMKLTGTFGFLNQILGIIKFSR